MESGPEPCRVDSWTVVAPIAVNPQGTVAVSSVLDAKHVAELIGFVVVAEFQDGSAEATFPTPVGVSMSMELSFGS